MANESNLKPLNKRTQRERKEIARMGAEASNKIQAHKKTLKEAANILLSMPVSKEIKAELKKYKIANDSCTYAMAVVVAQLKKSLNGDTRAFMAIRDTLDENSKDNKFEETLSDSIVINVIPASE